MDETGTIMAEIRTELRAINDRLDRMEAAGNPPVVSPTADGKLDLYDFKRPAVRNVTPWIERQMSQNFDVDEATARALHGVNWRGFVLTQPAYDAAWREIEALKSGDPAITEVYRAANLDPALAGFCLLTGHLEPVASDEALSSSDDAKRRALEGLTIETFLGGMPYFRGRAGSPRVG